MLSFWSLKLGISRERRTESVGGWEVRLQAGMHLHVGTSDRFCGFPFYREETLRPLGHVDFRDLGNGEFFVPGARGLKGSIGEASSKGSVALFPAGISLSCGNTGFCAGLPALKFYGYP